MSKIYLPSRGASDWQGLLADPVKHWRMGYSARTLAMAWEAAQNGLPSEVVAILGPDASLLLALPEHKVPLPPRGADSQSDIFILARIDERTAAVTIEGKVNEPFGPLVSEWLVEASEGKKSDCRQSASYLAWKLCR